MVFGPGGRDHDSRNQIFIFGDTKTLNIIREKANHLTNPNHFRISHFGKSKNLKNGKGGDRQIQKIHLMYFSEISQMGDQHLP